MSFGLNAADLGADLSDLSDSDFPLPSSEPIKLQQSQLTSPFNSQLQSSQFNHVLSSPLSSMSSMRSSLNAPRVTESADFQWHFSPHKNSNAPVTPQHHPDPNHSSSLRTSQTNTIEGLVPPSANDELLRQKLSVLRQNFDALNSEHQELRNLTAALTQQHSQQEQSTLAWQWQFQQAQQHIAFLMSNSGGARDGLNEMRGRALELATAETQRLEAALLSVQQERDQERVSWSQSTIQDRASAESAGREVDRLRVEIEQLAVAYSASKKQQERHLQADDLRAAQQVQSLADAESRAVAAERSAQQWRSQFEHEQQSVLDHQANISTLQRSLAEAHARIASKEQELNASRTYQEQLGAELERTKMELIDLKQMDGGVQVSRDAEMQRLSEIHTQQLAASRRALIEMQLRAEKAESRLQQSVLQQQQQQQLQFSQQVQAEQPLSTSSISQKRDATPVTAQHNDIELHQAMGIFDQSEIQTFAPSSPHKTPADITTAVSPAEMPRRVSDLFTSPIASPALNAVAAPAMTPSLQNDSKFSPLSMSLLATPAMQPALESNHLAHADMDLGSRTRLFFDDVEEHNLFHQPEEPELFDSKPTSPISVADRGSVSLVMSAPIFSPVAPAPLHESLKHSPSAAMSDQFSDIVQRLQQQLNTATDDVRQANQAKRIAETNCEELRDQIADLQFQLKTVHHQLLQQQSMSRSQQTERRPQLEPKFTQTDVDPIQDVEHLQRLSIERLQQQKRDYELQLDQLHHRHQLEVSALQNAISNQEKSHAEALAQLQTQHRLAISSMQIEHNIALDQCALEQQTKARAWFESSLQRQSEASQQQFNSSSQVAAERVKALETVISDLQSQLSAAFVSIIPSTLEYACAEVQTELLVAEVSEPKSCSMQARGTNTDPQPELSHPQPIAAPAKQDAFSTLLLKRAREECCQLKEANERLLASHISLRQEHDSVRQQLSALQQQSLQTSTHDDKVPTKANEPILSSVAALQATPPRALSRSARLTNHSQSGRSLISSIDGSVVTEAKPTADRPQPQPVAALSPAHFRASPLFDDSDDELSLVLSKPIVPSLAPSQPTHVPVRAEALPVVQPVVKSVPKPENVQRDSVSFAGRAERPASSTTSSLRDSSDSVRDRFSALRRSLQGLLPASSSSRYQHNVE